LYDPPDPFGWYEVALSAVSERTRAKSSRSEEEEEDRRKRCIVKSNSYRPNHVIMATIMVPGAKEESVDRLLKRKKKRKRV
jgi:hypothetical protein